VDRIGLLTGACRPRRARAVGAEAPERRYGVVVLALPAARVAGGTVADAGRLPLHEEPVLEQPPIVGRRHGRRLPPQHRDVRVLAPARRDRRRPVPVVGPAEVRVDGGAAVRGGVHEPGSARGRAVALGEEAERTVPGADRERAQRDADRHVEVGAAHAVVAGGDPAVGGHEGGVGVVDGEDVDGGAPQ